MPMTSGSFGNEFVEKSLEDAKKRLYDICNKYLAGEIKGSTVNVELKKLKKSINDTLSFYSPKQQEEFTEAYKNELEFLFKATDSKNTIADIITADSVNHLINGDVVIDVEDVEEITEEAKPSPTTIYKQDEEIEKKIEELEKIKEGYYSEELDEEALNEYLTKIKEIKAFFNGSSRRFSLNKMNDSDIKSKFDLVTDKLQETVMLENFMQFSLDYEKIDSIASEEISKEDFEKVESIKLESERRITFCEKRLEYYNGLLEKESLSDEEIENIETSLEELNDFKFVNVELLSKTEKLLKERKIEQVVEEKKAEVVQETEEIKVEEQDLSDEEIEYPSLEEDEYFESLVSSHQSDVQPDVEVDLEKIEEALNKKADEISKEEKTTEEIEQEQVEAVSKRISDMIVKRNISSKKSIENELDDIYEEMLVPKKKKGFFKKEEKKFYGDVSEDIFIDIRSVFACINMEEKFLEEKYADEFAKKIFDGGVPHYMLEDMDRKTTREFLTALTKYTKMCDSDMFTQREKENFEKFVLQPFQLINIKNNMKEKEEKKKGFTEELEEETHSNEEIIKAKRSHEEEDKKPIDINKEK